MWELEYGATKKSFEAWGLSNLRRTLMSAASDIVTFTHDGADFDADPLFPYNTKVVIWRNSVRWFTGWVRSIPRYGSAASEAIEYRLEGPWHFLERIEFEQDWPTASGYAPGSSVIFGYQRSEAGALVMATTAMQLAQILDFAIDAGAPFSYSFDTADFALQPPATEEVDFLCSEAVALVLRWHKDVVTWVDYSTATPKIHFLPHAKCPAVSLDVSSGEVVESVSVRSRDDLRVNGVLIRYNKTDTIDGVEYYNPTIDTAGATGGLDVVKMSIAFGGASLSWQRQTILCVICPMLDNDITAFLMEKNPGLVPEKNDEIEEIEWSDFYYDFAEYHVILLEGTVPDWVGETDTGEWSATCKITYKNGTIEKRYFSATETTTDARNGTYRRLTSMVPSDPIPTGVAAKLYAQLSILHFEGSVSIVEGEPADTLRPGKVLNLTGGRAEWATMRAQIQQVEEDIDAGRTTARFGPPEHLTPQDFAELIRANRRRNNVVNSGHLSGNPGGSNTFDLDGPTPNSAGSSQHEKYEALTVESEVDLPEGGKAKRAVKINPSSTDWKPGKGLYVSEDGKEMKLDYLRSVAPEEGPPPDP